MPPSFTSKIAPHVLNELRNAKDARERGASSVEFKHLENAHVLGQESTYWHTKVHLYMFTWGVRHLSIREILGQAIRVVGALTKTAIGLVPEGNTGGANVSPFKAMPLKPAHRLIIHAARSGSGF